VFFGKSIVTPAAQARPATPPPAAAVGAYGSVAHVRIPGTVVLVSVFFVAFVLYYFINWKYLSEVWPMR
jgi:cytochrome c oxidase subunit 1